MQRYYYLIKRKFIEWMFLNEIKKEVYEKYRDEFSKAFGEGTDLSKAKMYAIRYLWYEKFCEFMFYHKFILLDDKNNELKEFKKQIIEHGSEEAINLSDSEPASKLIRLINIAIESGDVVIFDETVDDINKIRRPIVGRVLKNGNIAIIPEKAIEITKQRSLNQTGIEFSANKEDITRGLKEKGLLIDSNKDSDLKTINCERIEGAKKREACWVFNKSVFGYIEENTNATPVAKSMIPLYVKTGFDNLKLSDGVEPDATQKNNVRVEVFNKLHFSQKEAIENSELIEMVMRTYFYFKNWTWDYREKSVGKQS